MRSMTSIRGQSEGTHTLNYDEVVMLFRKFQGGTKGTVQYRGSLLKLMDVPCWSVAISKVLVAFSRALAALGSVKSIEKVIFLIVVKGNFEINCFVEHEAVL